MTLPQFLSHVRTWLPDFSFETVLDVGADVARSTPAIRQELPGAAVHALTPVRASLEKLRDEGLDVGLHRIGLGFTPEPMTAELAGVKAAAELAEAGEEGDVAGLGVTRGDIFCREHGISRISLLNVETGNLDFDVVKGFGLMLSDGRIDLIQADCNIHPLRKWPGLRDFMELLEPLGFQIFHIYDQKMERRGYPALASARCAFIASRVASQAQELKRQANSLASRM